MKGFYEYYFKTNSSKWNFDEIHTSYADIERIKSIRRYPRRYLKYGLWGHNQFSTDGMFTDVTGYQYVNSAKDGFQRDLKEGTLAFVKDMESWIDLPSIYVRPRI